VINTDQNDKDVDSSRSQKGYRIALVHDYDMTCACACGPLVWEEVYKYIRMSGGSGSGFSGFQMYCSGHCIYQNQKGSILM